MARAVVRLENDVENLANELAEVTMQTEIVKKAPTNFFASVPARTIARICPGNTHRFFLLVVCRCSGRIFGICIASDQHASGSDSHLRLPVRTARDQRFARNR